MERSLYWYIGRLCILINTYTTALNTKQVVRKALFPPCSTHFFISNYGQVTAAAPNLLGFSRFSGLKVTEQLLSSLNK